MVDWKYWNKVLLSTEVLEEQKEGDIKIDPWCECYWEYVPLNKGELDGNRSN